MQNYLTFGSGGQFYQKNILPKIWYAVCSSAQACYQAILEFHGERIGEQDELSFPVFSHAEMHMNATSSQTIDMAEEMSCGNMDNEAILQANMAKLERIRHFNINWNGYGAQPIDTNVIEKIALLLPLLHKQPEVFPTACNSIQFEYEKANGEYLEFVVTKDKVGVFRMDAQGNETNDDIDGTPEEINKVVKAFYGIFEYSVK